MGCKWKGSPRWCCPTPCTNNNSCLNPTTALSAYLTLPDDWVSSGDCSSPGIGGSYVLTRPNTDTNVFGYRDNNWTTCDDKTWYLSITMWVNCTSSYCRIQVIATIGTDDPPLAKRMQWAWEQAGMSAGGNAWTLPFFSYQTSPSGGGPPWPYDPDSYPETVSPTLVAP